MLELTVNDSWFGILLLSLGVGLFAWVQIDFAGLVRTTGRLSRWAYLLPSTPVGLRAVAAFALMGGVSVLTYRGTRTPFQDALAIAMAIALVGGLVHDLIQWFVLRGRGREL